MEKNLKNSICSVYVYRYVSLNQFSIHLNIINIYNTLLCIIHPDRFQYKPYADYSNILFPALISSLNTRFTYPISYLISPFACQIKTLHLSIQLRNQGFSPLTLFFPNLPCQRVLLASTPKLRLRP